MFYTATKISLPQVTINFQAQVTPGEADWIADAIWRFGVKVARKVANGTTPAVRGTELHLLSAGEATEEEQTRYDDFLGQLNAAAAKVAAKKNGTAQAPATEPEEPDAPRAAEAIDDA